MNVYYILFFAIGAIVVYDFIMNGIRLYTESKKLKAAGKTPLTLRNSLVVFLAAIVELVVVFLITLFFAKIKVSADYLGVFLMFCGMYIFKNVGAYMTAWATWTAFVKVDQKKAIEKVKADKEEALQ